METIISQFKAFLIDQPSGRQTTGSSHHLSKISVKNYVSDVRRFLEWFRINHHELNAAIPHRLNETHTKVYLNDLQAQHIPHTTLVRYISSLRRFSTFLEIVYQQPPLIITSLTPTPPNFVSQPLEPSNTDKLLLSFKEYLKQQSFSDSTVKNYVSDLKHLMTWNANGPKLEFDQLFEPHAQNTYSNYLKINNTPSTTISRRFTAFKAFLAFARSKQLLGQPKKLEPVVSTTTYQPLAVTQSRTVISISPRLLFIPTFILIITFLYFSFLRPQPLKSPLPTRLSSPTTDFPKGKVAGVSTQGGTVLYNGSPSTSPSLSIGTAIIRAGQTEVTVNNNLITTNTMIYLTPISNPQGEVPYIKTKTESQSFTIAINNPLSADLSFNYWLLQN